VSPAGSGASLGSPDLDAWQAWQPEEVARLLQGCLVPWCVAGGWAIDVHVGRQTREHEDLEIAIPASQFGVFRHFFGGFDLYDASGGRWLGPDDVPTMPEHHQVWVWERAVGAWRLDIFLEPGDEETWVSHRDEHIRMPLREAILRTGSCIPYLRPEIVLFTKAQRAEAKDDHDLAAAMPTLDALQRRWLAQAIELLYPGHRWLASIWPDGSRRP
jgi:Aminoglycoside-2''-adenylyltransferase